MQTLTGELARSALDAAPDALIIIGADGVVRFANRQASALFGYPREELVGKHVERLIPARVRARHAGHRESYFTAPRLRPMGAGLTLFACRHDGGEFPVEISLSPVGADPPLVAERNEIAFSGNFEAPGSSGIGNAGYVYFSSLVANNDLLVTLLDPRLRHG